MKSKFVFILVFFVGIFCFSQENSKEIIIPEVIIVDTINSANNYNHFKNILKNSILIGRKYNVVFSGKYIQGENEDTLDGTFDFIIKDQRIEKIIFTSPLKYGNSEKITNALKSVIVIMLSHRNFLTNDKILLKYRCGDLGDKKWGFRFVKNDKEKVKIEDSAQHYFTAQLSNQGQIDSIESSSVNSQQNMDYHFVSKYKSLPNGVFPSMVDGKFINPKSHNIILLNMKFNMDD